MKNTVAILTKDNNKLGAIIMHDSIESRVNFEWNKFKNESNLLDSQLKFGFIDFMKKEFDYVLTSINVKTY
jgi:hypothetical protein